MTRPPLLLLATALSLSGCSGHFFSASGNLSSAGPSRIDIWSSTPQGCIRTTADQPDSLFTLLWEDPGFRNPAIANRDTAPDAPMRLELSATQPTVAKLETLRHPGIALTAANCSVLQVKTSEHAPAAPNARPWLSGQLQLECRANGNQLAASITFDRCQY